MIGWLFPQSLRFSEVQMESMQSNKINKKQDCSYQAEALNVPTAFYGLWSSKNIKKFNEIKIYHALIVPNWPKWQSLNPVTLQKLITGEIFFQI